MNHPSVTIGIPFFNAARSLRKSVQSVFAQAFEDWELILVDDGSTDAGLAVARSITDPRVRVLSDGKNLGVAARRNQIASLARGRYLAWLDADDLMHPARLRREFEYLEANPDVDVVGTSAIIIGPDGRVVGKRLVPSPPRASIKPAEVPMIQGSVMGRIEWFRRNPQDPELVRTADLDLWVRTLPSCRLVNLGEPLTFYTDYDAFSFRKYRLACQCVRKVVRRHGPRTVGHLRTNLELLRTWLKPVIYAAAHLVGAHRLLIRRRNLPLGQEERATAEAVVEKILRLELPTQPDQVRS